MRTWCIALASFLGSVAALAHASPSGRRLPMEGFDYATRERVRSMVGSYDRAGLAESRAGRDAAPVTPLWGTFQQSVTHADPTQGTFEQRFALFQTGASEPSADAPVFFYLGGEGPLEMFFGEVFALQLAQEFGANIYFLEHRMYGQSVPRGTLSTAALAHLNVGEALSDIDAFVAVYGNRGGRNVILGCSYSGALATFYRKTRTHNNVGAYGPSGPVLAQTNFTGYMDQFATTGGSACADAVTKATKAIEAATPEVLAAKFKSCSGAIDAKDMVYFKWTIAVTLAGEAQEDLPPSFPVVGTCQKLVGALNGGQDPVDAYAALFDNLSGNPKCNDFSEENMIASLRSTGVQDNYDGTRSWYWQKCSEFGYWKSAYGTRTSPFAFEVPVEHLVRFCERIFDIPGMTPNTAQINEQYGAKNPVGETNAMVTQGTLDPWHLLGLTPPIPKDVGVESVMYAAGHCAPLHANTTADPPSLVEAREKIRDFFARILA